MAKTRRKKSSGAFIREEEDIPEWTVDVPNDPVTEQVVLGAALAADPETCDRILASAPTDAFQAKPHKILREAIGEARRKNLELDPAILMRLAPDVDLMAMELIREARPDVPENLDYHISNLLWDWRRAKAVRGPISKLIDRIQDPKESPERIRGLAKAVAEAFEGNHGRGRYLRDSGEVISEMMKRLRKRIAGEAYFPYGIKGLDQYEDGTIRLRPGTSPTSMSLVTALSGSGKSTLMGHFALNIARQRRRVLFGAWEEEAPVTIELLTTLALRWSRTKILDGKSHRVREEGEGDEWIPMTHEELVTFEETAHKISQWVTFFDNPFQHTRARAARELTNDDHLDIIHDHISLSGCDVFFADLLHRCFIDDSPSAEKLALFRLLAITQEQKIHTIAAHQQRAKDIEKRSDPRPTREGIMGAGAWLDTFWTVIAPHLPAKWKAVTDDTLEIIILKQRNGPWPIGIEFDWDPDTGQISGGRSIDVKNPIETSEAFTLKGKAKKPAGFHVTKRR